MLDGTPYANGNPGSHTHYVWPALRSAIAQREWRDRRAFDLGCGGGSASRLLSDMGFAVTGVDVDANAVAVAAQAHPCATFAVGSGYDDLAARYGRFPLVISLDVIEHCFDPLAFARTFISLIAPGGVGMLSTPYHGYLKNLALAVSGRMDRHFTALHVGGHIKFFSIENAHNPVARGRRDGAADQPRWAQGAVVCEGDFRAGQRLTFRLVQGV
jgi:2-polyprenyl-3-methyl-5-hydroxy-6-metoxy-1,4-benzoquinol methylase